MAKQHSILRRAILLVIVLLVLIPCSVLLLDVVGGTGQETVELYYMMNDGQMKPVERKISEGTEREMLDAALNELKAGPKIDGASPSVPEAVNFLSAELEGSTVKLDISNGYYRMKNTEEVVCRSSLVWSLTSLDFVEQVELSVEGTPLQKKTGTPYGPLSRNNVLIDAVISAETTEYAILKLYFANADGTDLSVEERVVEVNANQAREKTILEQLIAGPAQKDHHKTIPMETKIRDVTTTSDGTCYVNLSADFVTKHVGGEIEELLTVYSMVNSLCELDYIDKVQFLIEGEKIDQFKGYLEFKTPFAAVSSLKTAEAQ